MYEGYVPEKIIHERTGHLSFTRISTYFLAAPCKSDFINLVSEAVAQVSVGVSLPNTSASVHSAYGSCLPPTGSSEASVGPSSTGISSF